MYGTDDEEEDKNEDDFDEYTNNWGSKKSAYYSGNKMENDETIRYE